MPPTNHPIKPGSIGTVEIASEQVCVAYNVGTGDIVHVHRIVNLRGAKVRAESEIEGRNNRIGT
jgi:hypothetical protein